MLHFISVKQTNAYWAIIPAVDINYQKGTDSWENWKCKIYKKFNFYIENVEISAVFYYVLHVVRKVDHPTVIWLIIGLNNMRSPRPTSKITFLYKGNNSKMKYVN